MNQVNIIDQVGNHRQYTLEYSDAINNLSELKELVSQPITSLKKEKDFDREHIRSLLVDPQNSLHPVLSLAETQHSANQSDFLHLTYHCDHETYIPPNLKQRHLACFQLHRDLFSTIFNNTLEIPKLNLKKLNSNSKVECFSELIHEFYALEPSSQLKLISAAARFLYRKPFENASKLTRQIPFRGGPAMWAHLSLHQQHRGGVCSEKTAALRFFCDCLNIPTTHIVASNKPIPEDLEEEYQGYFEQHGNGQVPFWLQHHLLEIHLGPERYLVDITGGNMCFLFLNSQDSAPFFQVHYRTKMVTHTDYLNLKRVSTELGDLLLTLSEYHSPHLIYEYIFRQNLGLLIDHNTYLSAYLDYGQGVSARYQSFYTHQALKKGFPPPFFYKDSSTPIEGQYFLEPMLQSYQKGLIKALPYPEYTGDITLVFQPLKKSRSSLAKLSPEIASSLLEVPN